MTRSSRLRERTAAITWVESVRWRRFDQVEFFEAVEQRVQQQQFGVSRDQAGAKLAQHAVVKTRIGELQGQSILPVNATAYGIGGLPVRKVLDKLKERHQGQVLSGKLNATERGTLMRLDQRASQNPIK